MSRTKAKSNGSISSSRIFPASRSSPYCLASAPKDSSKKETEVICMPEKSTITGADPCSRAFSNRIRIFWPCSRDTTSSPRLRFDFNARHCSLPHLRRQISLSSWERARGRLPCRERIHQCNPSLACDPVENELDLHQIL